MEFRRKITKSRKTQNNKNGYMRYILGICVVSFIAMSVFVTIQSVATGNELGELENKARELSEENKRLSEKLIKTSSLSDKYDVAEELGFSKPTDIVYLNGDTTVATLR